MVSTLLTPIVAALTIAAPGAAQDEPGLSLRAPADAPVSSPFGSRWGRAHLGIDFGSAGADSPAVVAAADGLVLKTGFVRGWGGYGRIVLIGHPDGYRTLYAHLASVAVEPRQRVAAGESIGVMGCTGSCHGAHLHFEVRKGDEALDPARFLAPE